MTLLGEKQDIAPVAQIEALLLGAHHICAAVSAMLCYYDLNSQWAGSTLQRKERANTSERTDIIANISENIR